MSLAMIARGARIILERNPKNATTICLIVQMSCMQGTSKHEATTNCKSRGSTHLSSSSLHGFLALPTIVVRA